MALYIKEKTRVQAREIAQGQTFYVNTTNKTAEVRLGKCGKGILSEKEYKDVLILAPYDAELIIE